MSVIYLIVLAACSIAVLALVAWRLLHLGAYPRPSRGRMVNEWIWTVIPVAILVTLVWRAVVAK